MVEIAGMATVVISKNAFDETLWRCFLNAFQSLIFATYDTVQTCLVL